MVDSIWKQDTEVSCRGGRHIVMIDIIKKLAVSYESLNEILWEIL